jgi:hypothetical protein
MYTERELRSRLLTLGWLIVECVDDDIDQSCGHQGVTSSCSDETNAELVADLRRTLKRRRLGQGGRTLVARSAYFNVVDGLVAQFW